MKLKNCDYKTFLKDVSNKKVVCFGVGKMLSEMQEEFINTPIKQIIGITDNNHSQWYSKKTVFGEELEVLPPSIMFTLLNEDIVILITSNACLEIVQQLESVINNSTTCYIFPFLRSLQQDKDALNASKNRIIIRNNQPNIPKKIHYTWFSGQKMPESMIKCKESWKKYCPDYQIIEWNQENYDVTKCKYMQQAIENKKWGFAGDYARLDLIYKYGGIYLDLDVELVKNLDELLYNEAYASFESTKFVNFGSGFGAVAGFSLLKEMMSEYERIDFVDSNGLLNLAASPVYQTKVLEKLGLRRNGSMQLISGMTIYPFDFLCAQSVLTGIIYQTENTHSIHRFAASWMEDIVVEERNKKLELLRKISI
ncbi:hypothetical protein acsn021_05240 [Anaerocolumna cellulosilytica]|uniref:Uncharacterized protein n=1 Tax=Anaerocolumna cellulosilytica TaxID=433286 RepID=A0A6S6R018_9FIRM|nr:glycosyltransferase [Anaerocolumna cellulosilytica]MBB5195709.1 Pyruvate/2-oxoacid:ferredoxin oxidoreductase delta subunit [Anaerocolumna cellulosilytica]BCJ92955.1 hypothetical protein acsn021_05240 [Anaerocolumna cellulosilytica]